MSIPVRTDLYYSADGTRTEAAESNPGLSSTAMPMKVSVPKLPGIADCRPLFSIETINGGSLHT